jgi:hypothetical protein
MALQAITITYKSQGARLGSRMVAQCAAGKLTVPYDHQFDAEGNAKEAARALIKKLGWTWSEGRKGAWSLGALWQGQYVMVYHEVGDAAVIE